MKLTKNTVRNAYALSENLHSRSAWKCAVIKYAQLMIENVAEWLEYDQDNTKTLAARDIDEYLRNGARSWDDASKGGKYLIYNDDIARTLCSPSEYKRAHNSRGELRANANVRETWLECQGRAAFPGVKFGLSHSRNWGDEWRISWQDGPTVEEFNSATDLEIFCRSWDTFDGMTDCTGRGHAEFTDFAGKFMQGDGSAETSREMSTEKQVEIVAAIVEAAPAAAEGVTVDRWGTHYRRHDWTDKERAAICERFGCSWKVFHLYTCSGQMDVRELARAIWSETSYYTAPQPPTEPTGCKGKKTSTESAQETAEPTEVTAQAEPTTATEQEGDTTAGEDTENPDNLKGAA